MRGIASLAVLIVSIGACNRQQLQPAPVSGSCFRLSFGAWVIDSDPPRADPRTVPLLPTIVRFDTVEAEDLFASLPEVRRLRGWRDSASGRFSPYLPGAWQLMGDTLFAFFNGGYGGAEFRFHPPSALTGTAAISGDIAEMLYPHTTVTRTPISCPPGS